VWLERPDALTRAEIGWPHAGDFGLEAKLAGQVMSGPAFP
jgi:hypothetical protein